MDVKNTHSVTKTEISVFGRQALDAERRRYPSLADKVLRAMLGFERWQSTNKGLLLGYVIDLLCGIDGVEASRMEIMFD